MLNCINTAIYLPSTQLIPCHTVEIKVKIGLVAVGYKAKFGTPTVNFEGVDDTLGEPLHFSPVDVGRGIDNKADVLDIESLA